MHTSSKVFVGGISYSTDDMSLSEAFSKYGDVVEAKVIIDRNTGRSKGFAFVTFTSTEAASSAIQAFDGQELHGRRIKVNYATEKSRSGGFGGGFGPNDGYNYGGPGGNYGGGRFQSGGFGGSSGGSYTGGDGDYSRSGGFGSGDQYPSNGGEFGSNDNFSGGGAQGNGNWRGSDSNYFTGQGGGSFSSDHETAGPYGNNQGKSNTDHDGIDPKFDNFGQGMDGNDRDDYDESNNFANTRK
ncbi:glycine-rich RNA-binding protein [Dorcoceras hygrometricum]|uniref:Glycine-rich RNA-binding protein n=1 Tax=Dorcoceras hygrometricum TaxID=472368 RepID=A0A2Z7AUG1_9LAMI|nr:glycine-rich RNA-binding protein [Dorcoceras hygrometricum]